MLTAEEEASLSARWRNDADGKALDRLVGSHLRLVVKIAKGFGGYGLPMSELIAEGNVGLMQAAEKFDPALGFRFATYAIWWIRAAIQEYVLRSSSLVKMGTTAAQKKLFYNLRRLKAAHEVLGDGDLAEETVTAIAEELDVPEADVIEMNRRIGAADQSLNAPRGTESGDEWQDVLVDETPHVEAWLSEADELDKRRALMNEALGRLNDRERHILVQRKLSEDPLTLGDLSEVYGISRERVRQIEARALEKLGKDVRGAAAKRWQLDEELVDAV